jgi:hypothetical protein
MKNRAVLYGLPAGAALLFMLPRLASPQFGFLDDAATLKYGRELTHSFHSLLGIFTAIGDTGRFIPFYWLYYSVVYWLGWANPLIFYLANAVSLIVIVVTLVSFMRFRGASVLQASAAGILFVLCGPALESYYTNSQEGCPQLALIGTSFVLLAAYSVAKVPAWRFLISLCLFLVYLGANCAMETSVAMAGVAIGWAVSARLRLSAVDDRLTSAATRTMAVTALFAAIAWYLLRAHFLHVSLTGGTYTSGYKLQWQQFVSTGSGWLSLLFRDFPYLLPLAIPMLILTLGKRQAQTRLIIDSLVWVSAWVCIYLPWQSALEYYMLPCAIGCAILGGIAVGQMWELLRSYRRLSIRAAATLAAALLLVTCVNNWTNARYQMAMDRSNMALIDYLATLPLHSRVLINIQEPNEYEYEIGLHLVELKQRPDIVVDYFRLQTASPDEGPALYYVATPIVENELHPSVRYGLYQGGAAQWGRVLSEFIGKKSSLVYHVENQMRSADIGLHRLICPLVGPGRGLYCNVPRPFIDGRMLAYGWDVYRVARRVEDVAQPAVFFPGGSWLLRLANGAVRHIRFGEAGDYPLSGDWDHRGATGIGVYRPSNKTWYIDSDLDGKPDIVFQWNEMQPGDIPIAGDWYGQGRASPGFFRPADSAWHLLHGFHEEEGELVLHFGNPGDVPLAGDWDGDGWDTIGVYRRNTGEVVYQNVLAAKAALFSYRAKPGSTPVVGRWSGGAADSLAFVTDQSWSPRMVNCLEEPSNSPADFGFGLGGGRPLAGNWR